MGNGLCNLEAFEHFVCNLEEVQGKKTTVSSTQSSSSAALLVAARKALASGEGHNGSGATVVGYLVGPLHMGSL